MENETKNSAECLACRCILWRIIVIIFFSLRLTINICNFT